MPTLTPTDWVTLVAALAGAFAGALAAFTFEALRQWRKERREGHSAITQAQFILSMQLNDLLGLQEQYLDGEKDNPTRFAALGPFNAPMLDARVDLGTITFVAVKDGARVLHRVHAAQETYKVVMEILDSRNRFYRERVANFEGTAGPEFDVETGQGEFEVDPRAVAVLKGETDALYTMTEGAIKAERRAIESLVEVSKRLFPLKPVLPTDPPFIQKSVSDEA
jgi:hypothetical protein